MPPRKRRTNSEIFLEKLHGLSLDGSALIGNKALRDALEWDEEKYAGIKNMLSREKLIIVGRGKGGSVGLASRPGTTPLNVFLSYSHKDDKFKESLLAHLKPLERLNIVNQWHDGKILAGEKIDEVVYKNLNDADIILLLISVDFINSRYCYEVEMEKAMEKNASGSAVVIPVILRHCLWAYTPFGNLKAIPKDGRAIDAWISHDEAFTEVATHIHEVANAILERK